MKNISTDFFFFSKENGERILFNFGSQTCGGVVLKKNGFDIPAN